MRTLIKDLKPGKTLTVEGFIDKIRDQKSIQFIILRDRTGRAQITVFKPDLPEISEIFTTLTTDSVVSITGKIISAPQVKLGGLEIVPTSVRVLSRAKLSPIDENTGPDLAMDYRWIDLRDEKKREYFKIQTIAEHAMREFLIKNNFIEAHTPKLSNSGTEGGSEVFEVKYYDRKAYLTQSPQFYKQMAMAAGWERFFEVSSNYRAEKSYTSRHATEFFTLDLEMAHITSHHDVMDVQEKLLKYVLGVLHKKFGFPPAQKARFPRITLLESYELLKSERDYEVPRASKGDLDPEGERLLCEISREKYASDFIFITDFPASCRAFYSMRHDETPNTPQLCKSFDLLYRGLEISSGAQREHNFDRLIENIRAKGIDPDVLKSYTQFFEYGCPPHGGFAIGLARFFARLLDLHSVKDAVYLFRGPDRLSP